MMDISSVLENSSVKSTVFSKKKNESASSFATFLKTDTQTSVENSAVSRANSSSFFSRIGGSGLLKSIAINGSLGKHLQQLQNKIADALNSCGVDTGQKIDLALENGALTVTSDNQDADLIEAAINNDGEVTQLASETATEASDYAERAAKTKLHITPKDESDDDEEKKKKDIEPVWVEIKSAIDESFGKFSFENGILSSASVNIADSLVF